jgi:hypothetical protein
VNSGRGWSTWNPDGSFASLYVGDSLAHGITPVFTYYMLLQSKPGGDDEAQADLANLRNPATMAAYWADVRLLFRRARGPKLVVLHVEPDLWGYVQQAARGDDAGTVPAIVPDGLPQNAAGFAQEFVLLRNELAPNVVLAYHMSGRGTQHDIVYEDPPDATVRAYAARSAAFYRSLRARFDLSFEDFSDRDSGFYEKQHGNAAVWCKAADFRRHLLYARTFVRLAGVPMVAWQIPLGNTRMRAMDDTWDHYQDNRVQWLLDDPSRAHLRAYARAGSSPSSSAAARPGRPAPATPRRTGQRTRRSTGTRSPRSPPTTKAASSARRLTTCAGRCGCRERVRRSRRRAVPVRGRAPARSPVFGVASGW